jgi:hypothetical protein
MSVTLFTGAFVGALLGFATHNRRFSICKFLFEMHPALAKSIGVVLLCVMILIPALSLAGALTISTTPFFWGGCFTCSMIISFFMTSCMMMDSLQES